MPKGRPAATTADDIADNIKSLIDRVIDARFTQEMAQRSQELSERIAERGQEAGEFAGNAWRESRRTRRDATKRLSRATEDAAKWSDRTWKKSVRPALNDLWKQRTVALGAAGAAVPASRELVGDAAVRLGLKRREERHWAAFFVGLVLGAAAGAVVALLTTPKRGSEMRHELGTKADEVRQELAAKAKDAEWVPIFQRDANGHGDIATEPRAPGGEHLQDAAAEAGAATGEAADQAAADAAEAINESYEGVDRESPTS